MTYLPTNNRSGPSKVKYYMLIIITAGRFLASKNLIQLVILKFYDLGHPIESFIPKQM